MRTPRFVGHETSLIVFADSKHLLEHAKEMAHACIEIPPHAACFTMLDKSDLVMPLAVGKKNVAASYDNVESAMRSMA